MQNMRIFSSFLLGKKATRWVLPALSLSFMPLSALEPSSTSKEAPASETLKQEPKKELSPRITDYLKLMKDKRDVFGPLGKWQQSEIEVCLNPELIQKIENQTRLRLLSKGYAESEAERWSSVGVVAEDNYWVWVRDAVIFPSGVYGTYDRLLWKSSMDGSPEVAVLPLLSTKKIIVNVNFRHATRSWEIELPRGHKKEGETPEKTAARELKEETGYQLSKCTYLGTVAPDTGTLMTQLAMYCAEVSHSGETNKEYSEAIAQNPAFSKEELKQGFANGYIEVLIKGNVVKARCRDPFLSYALMQAEMKGFL